MKTIYQEIEESLAALRESKEQAGKALRKRGRRNREPTFKYWCRAVLTNPKSRIKEPVLWIEVGASCPKPQEWMYAKAIELMKSHKATMVEMIMVMVGHEHRPYLLHPDYAVVYSHQYAIGTVQNLRQKHREIPVYRSLDDFLKNHPH